MHTVNDRQEYMAAIWRRSTSIAPDEDDSNRAGETEPTLLAQAQADVRAFAPLYRHYYPAVYGFCLNRLANHDLAEDAAAITFTRCIAALPDFSPDPHREGSSFRSWLFTIARNVVIDHQRRTRHYLPLDNALPLRHPGESPEDQAIHHEQAIRLRSILAHLPDRQRWIVELRLAGLTGAEIAATLGTSLPAIKSAQTRAYATLRTLLDDSGDSQ
jgi:RNA polymerase sigma-70 factor (ECF subfamily)